ncbi:MAG: undecaprenyl/decaprenyl-phosphate alpha-N-acetylglucosaminyl 1-phosphate transferase [Candidatus Coatesbacteria bacterium]|nr:undecaprenyl/decaprenyl-phosphate alpha-N-acetylglucosaminyl 1-phosphate transferase [Candidatus Coatesbacteria bacterium]
MNLALVFALVFIVGTGLSLALTPVVRSVARRIGAMDAPGRRKIHSSPVPSLGGVAILVAFVASLLLGIWLHSGFEELLADKLTGVFIGCLILMAVGIYDDIRDIRPIFKLAGQVAATVVLLLYGFNIEKFTSPLSPSGSIAVPAAVGILLTVLWVVGLTNSINLIDGLDGLAAGIVFIASLTMMSVAIYRSDYDIALISIAIAGAVLGFLKYNFAPASIFMGDTGSNCLGFIFAAMSLLGTSKSTVAVALLVPIASMAVPLMDTGLAFFRRLIRGTHPFQGDREHLHHRLLALGLSQRQAVRLIYFISAYLGVIAFITVLIPFRFSFLILIILAMGLFLALKTLAYLEKHVAALAEKYEKKRD